MLNHDNTETGRCLGWVLQGLWASLSVLGTANPVEQTSPAPASCPANPLCPGIFQHVRPILKTPLYGQTAASTQEIPAGCDPACFGGIREKGK